MTPTPTATATTPTVTDQPAIALPTGRLLAAALIPSAVVGGGWALGAWGAGRGAALALPGLLAALTVGLAMTAGVLAITPWKARPVSLWISIWLGQTVVRLLVTPVLAYLLYSATPVDRLPFALAVGLTYLAAVVIEAAVLARYLKRSQSA